ncbi:MAG: methylated-DNA--[Clostridia bacterium]|nr:methylated-DNA--[protein]-cysteine S-methyltransferase [Clostridia bacterium]
MLQTVYDAPFGRLVLTCDGDALCALTLGDTSRRDTHPLLTRTAAQLDEYFAGKRQSFDLPLSPVGSPFQRRVWEELQQVPFGQTVTYGALAARIGSPRAARAVGNAVGANQLLIVIPCHRVVAANGIGGFACGLHIKRALMNVEHIKY